MDPKSPRAVGDRSTAANEQFLLDHGQRWLTAFLHTQLPDVPLARLLQSGRLLGYLAAVISARQGDNAQDELVAPSAQELLGTKKRKVARVLTDVNAFITLAAHMGVNADDLFSTSDIIEGRNTTQVCRTLWSLSHRCQQLNIPGVPAFASPEEEDRWRLLMPQGSALMVAQRYGRLSTSRRSRASLSRISIGSSPIKLGDESTDAAVLRGALEGVGEHGLADEEPRFRTHSGSPTAPRTPSPLAPTLLQAAEAGSPDAKCEGSPSPPRPRRPEAPLPRRQSLGFDPQPPEAPRRNAASPIPPHRRGVVRRISSDINSATPPPSPVQPAGLLPGNRVALSGFRNVAPAVLRGSGPADVRSGDVLPDEKLQPAVPLPVLREGFAAGDALPQLQPQPQPQPCKQPASPGSAPAEAPAASAAAAAEPAGLTDDAAVACPELIASYVPGLQANPQSEQSTLPPPDARAADALLEHQAAARMAAAGKVESPGPRSPPKQRGPLRPAIRLLGGKDREVPRFVRHAAIAALGLAAGHLLQQVHSRRGHVSVLKCDAVTKIPRRMLEGAVGPKPRHDPWRSVWG